MLEDVGIAILQKKEKIMGQVRKVDVGIIDITEDHFVSKVVDVY